LPSWLHRPITRATIRATTSGSPGVFGDGCRRTRSGQTGRGRRCSAPERPNIVAIGVDGAESRRSSCPAPPGAPDLMLSRAGWSPPVGRGDQPRGRIAPPPAYEACYARSAAAHRGSERGRTSTSSRDDLVVHVTAGMPAPLTGPNRHPPATAGGPSCWAPPGRQRVSHRPPPDRRVQSPPGPPDRRVQSPAAPGPPVQRLPYRGWVLDWTTPR